MSTLSFPRLAPQTRRLRSAVIAFSLLTMFVCTAMAGSTDGWDIGLDLFEGWLSGGMGKAIAYIALIGAVIGCAAKQSMAPAGLFVGLLILLVGGAGVVNVAITGTV